MKKTNNTTGNSEAVECKELKIGFLFRRNKYSEAIVPEIRLNGKWLEKLGFGMGQKVKVEYKNGQIVLII